jgi:hypothetical protein
LPFVNKKPTTITILGEKSSFISYLFVKFLFFLSVQKSSDYCSYVKLLKSERSLDRLTYRKYLISPLPPQALQTQELNLSPPLPPDSWLVFKTVSKVRPCTGTEALYRPDGPQRE